MSAERSILKERLADETYGLIKATPIYNEVKSKFRTKYKMADMENKLSNLNFLLNQN